MLIKETFSIVDWNSYSVFVNIKEHTSGTPVLKIPIIEGKTRPAWKTGTYERYTKGDCDVGQFTHRSSSIQNSNRHLNAKLQKLQCSRCRQYSVRNSEVAPALFHSTADRLSPLVRYWSGGHRFFRHYQPGR